MNERFTKMNDQLIGLGLPPRLVMLYGKLVFHAGKDGRCYPKHSTLAKEIGLTSPTSHQHVLRLLRELQRLRLIRWRRGRYSNTYQVLDPDTTFLSGQIRHGCRISDTTRMSYRKETTSKETLKRAPSPTPSPGSQQPTADRDRPKAKAKAFSKVDDEPTKPALSPEQEFRDRLRQRHGSGFDADRCIANIQRQLMKSGGLDFANFAVYDAAHTTGEHFKNPNGYYVHLAKELVSVTRTATVNAYRSPRGPGITTTEPPRNGQGRCSTCGGLGELQGGTFCECSLGRDLKRARRPVKSELKPPARTTGAA